MADDHYESNAEEWEQYLNEWTFATHENPLEFWGSPPRRLFDGGIVAPPRPNYYENRHIDSQINDLLAEASEAQIEESIPGVPNSETIARAIVTDLPHGHYVVFVGPTAAVHPLVGGWIRVPFDGIGRHEIEAVHGSNFRPAIRKINCFDAFEKNHFKNAVEISVKICSITEGIYVKRVTRMGRTEGIIWIHVFDFKRAAMEIVTGFHEIFRGNADRWCAMFSHCARLEARANTVRTIAENWRVSSTRNPGWKPSDGFLISNFRGKWFINGVKFAGEEVSAKAVDAFVRKNASFRRNRGWGM